MKKIKMVLPVLAILIGVAAAFASKTNVKADNQSFVDRYWFAYNGPNTPEGRTQQSNYSLIGTMEPTCIGSAQVCAILSTKNASNKPDLDVSGGDITTGSHIQQIDKKN